MFLREVLIGIRSHDFKILPPEVGDEHGVVVILTCRRAQVQLLAVCLRITSAAKPFMIEPFRYSRRDIGLIDQGAVGGKEISQGLVDGTVVTLRSELRITPLGLYGVEDDVKV